MRAAGSRIELAQMRFRLPAVESPAAAPPSIFRSEGRALRQEQPLPGAGPSAFFEFTGKKYPKGEATASR